MAPAAKKEERVSVILRHISLPLANFALELSTEMKGPITVLFGPSGAGKTSLLDLIAGLRSPLSAFIQVGDHVLTDTEKGISIPTYRRRVGYVPQDLALFPNMSVRQNLLYGYKPMVAAQSNIDHVIDLLDVRSLLPRNVTQLSGGEKQRVALGRALLASPRLLLLDEPLASLDLPLKRKILPYLARIRDEFRIPMIYVTHDRFETLSLADEVIVLIKGRVSQKGPTREVFSRPANLAVAGLLTVETIVPGRVLEISRGLAVVEVGSIRLTALDPDLPSGSNDVHVCINADDVILLRSPEGKPSSARNHLVARVEAVTPEGWLTRVDLDCGFPLTAFVTKQACEELGVRVGDALIALIKAPSVHLISR